MNKQFNTALLRQWNFIHAAGMCVCLLEILLFKHMYLAAAWVLASIGWAWLALGPKPVFSRVNFANMVTLTRCLGVLLTISIAPKLSHFQVGILLSLFVILDALDGFLARKLGIETKLGEYLDMESDSLFVALSAALIYLTFSCSAFLILVGFMRYFYVILIKLLKLDDIEERRFEFARVVAVMFFIALLLPWFSNSIWSITILYLVSIGVALSFLYSGIRLVSDARFQRLREASE